MFLANSYMEGTVVINALKTVIQSPYFHQAKLLETP